MSSGEVLVMVPFHFIFVDFSVEYEMKSTIHKISGKLSYSLILMIQYVVKCSCTSGSCRQYR
jgi:hypothetical protein